MYSSPIAVDQRACPSFLSPREDRYARSLSTALTSLPVSLQDIAMMEGGNERGRANVPLSSSSSQPPRAMTSRQRTRASRDVYETLLIRDAIARERKEEARELALRREMSQCRAVPKISAMGHNIQRELDIVDRLERVHKEKQNLNELRQREWERDQERRMEGWFVPTITSRGRRTEGRATRLAAHVQQEEVMEKSREREHLAASLRRHRLVEGLDEVRSSPRINPRSTELVQRVRERDGLVGGMSHIESMMERDRLARLALWERQQVRNGQEKASFSPRITAYAATLQRNGDVVERLTALSAGRGRTECSPRGTATTKRDDTSARGRCCSAASPQKGRQRQQQRWPQKRHDDDDDERKRGHQEGRRRDLLLLSMDERYQQYKLRREEKIRSILEMERRLQTPTINPVSEVIAASLPVSSTERLTTGRTKRETKFVVQGGDNGRLASSYPSTGLSAEEYVPQIHTPLRRVRKGAAATVGGVGGTVDSGGCSSSCAAAAAAAAAAASLSSSSTTSQRQGKGDVYVRMCRWKKLRDERVQRLRVELQGEMGRVQEQLHADEELQDTPVSSALRSAKALSDSLPASRWLAVDTECASPPVVLSLEGRYAAAT